MPEGGTLRVRTQSVGAGRTLSVADTGTGVPEDLLDSVFEPFFSTKERGRGSGLGLAICREVARSHGGTIVLDSEPGIGTVVTLTLGSVRGPSNR